MHYSKIHQLLVICCNKLFYYTYQHVICKIGIDSLFIDIHLNTLPSVIPDQNVFKILPYVLCQLYGIDNCSPVCKSHKGWMRHQGFVEITITSHDTH